MLNFVVGAGLLRFVRTRNREVYKEAHRMKGFLLGILVFFAVLETGKSTSLFYNLQLQNRSAKAGMS